MNEHEAFLRVMTRITIAVALCILSGIGGCVYVNHKAFSEGYNEEMLPGSTTTHWVKTQK